MNLRPPTTTEQLTTEWFEDCPIDETEPSHELARIPNLHAKYLYILTHHRLLVKRYLLTLNTTRATMARYYSGQLNSKEDLAKYGLEPWHAILNRDAINNHVKSDEAVANLELKIGENEVIVETCENIIKEINNRTWQLQSIVKWHAFSKGMD